MPQPLREIVAVAETSQRRALELGCGTGHDALYLARHGWNVVGVDFSRPAIRRARRRARHVPWDVAVRLEFHVADVTNLEAIRPSFDLVFDRGCFHALPANRRPAYASTVCRLLSPGGVFLLFAFRPGVASPLGTTSSELRTLFEPDLELTSTQEGSSGPLRISPAISPRPPVPATWYSLRRR